MMSETKFPNLVIRWVVEREPEKEGEILILYFNGFVHYWKVYMWDEELNKWGEYYGDTSDCSEFRFWARLDHKEILKAQPEG